MAKTSKYPPLDQAKAISLDLQLNSRAQYIKWHTDTKCNYLPRYPERVYKDWVSWNDYLGTANVFKGEIQKPVRSFWEAVKWAQDHASVHNLNTMKEWLDWCSEHMDELPIDIPHRPDQRYVEWEQIGWKGWLGSDIRGRLAAAKMSTALLAICSIHNLRKAGNVYAIIQAEKGEVQLKGILRKSNELILVRVYKLPTEMKEEVVEMVQKYGRNDGEGWFIPNIGDLLFDLDMNLLQYQLPIDSVEPVPPLSDEDLIKMLPDNAYRHRVG